MKKRAPTGATRVEAPNKGSFGWLMRIRRGDVFHQEFFADGQHGGKRAAKREARARYRELAAELGSASTSEGCLSSRNSTGIVGVRLAQDGSAGDSDSANDAYVAFWRDKGRDFTIRFGCTKHGRVKAFELACLARELRSRDRTLLEAEHELRLNAKRIARKRPASATRKLK